MASKITIKVTIHDPHDSLVLDLKADDEVSVSEFALTCGVVWGWFWDHSSWGGLTDTPRMITLDRTEGELVGRIWEKCGDGGANMARVVNRASSQLTYVEVGDYEIDIEWEFSEGSRDRLLHRIKRQTE